MKSYATHPLYHFTPLTRHTGVAENSELAFRLMSLAAGETGKTGESGKTGETGKNGESGKNGVAFAQHMLGRYYEEGIVTKNTDKMLELYTAAARHGDGQAEFSLALAANTADLKIK